MPKQDELIDVPVRVNDLGLDGARAGVFLLHVFHSADCPRVDDTGRCNCDCKFGSMEWLHSLHGAN